MISEPQPKLVQPRVFYAGLAIAVVLLVADFLLLVRGHGTATQVEMYCVLFTLAILSVAYRYRSSNEQLKRLAARGVWFLNLILVGAGVVFVMQPQTPPNQPVPGVPAATEPRPHDPGLINPD